MKYQLLLITIGGIATFAYWLHSRPVWTNAEKEMKDFLKDIEQLHYKSEYKRAKKI